MAYTTAPPAPSIANGHWRAGRGHDQFWTPVQFGTWPDRAAFHFLRRRCISAVCSAAARECSEWAVDCIALSGITARVPQRTGEVGHKFQTKALLMRYRYAPMGASTDRRRAFHIELRSRPSSLQPLSRWAIHTRNKNDDAHPGSIETP